jgi:type II secretory ATPase GspE/PulE/Tfp pilus assembly ATPase PilB-like protein
MEIDDEVRELILEHASEEDLRNMAIRKGMTTLREDGIKKVQEGSTSVAEILRVIGTTSN